MRCQAVALQQGELYREETELLFIKHRGMVVGVRVALLVELVVLSPQTHLLQRNAAKACGSTGVPVHRALEASQQRMHHQRLGFRTRGCQGHPARRTPALRLEKVTRYTARCASLSSSCAEAGESVARIGVGVATFVLQRTRFAGLATATDDIVKREATGKTPELEPILGAIRYGHNMGTLYAQYGHSMGTPE